MYAHYNHDGYGYDIYVESVNFNYNQSCIPGVLVDLHEQGGDQDCGQINMEVSFNQIKQEKKKL